MFKGSCLSSVKPQNFWQLQQDDVSLHNRKSEFYHQRDPFHPVFLLYSSTYLHMDTIVQEEETSQFSWQGYSTHLQTFYITWTNDHALLPDSNITEITSCMPQVQCIHVSKASQSCCYVMGNSLHNSLYIP